MKPQRSILRLAEPFLLLVPILMILSAYCNTLSSPPVLDDFHSFIYQRSLELKDISLSSLVSPAHTMFGWTRWLPMLTFGLNISIGEGLISTFHITNMVIHILAFLCVFFLLSQLVGLEKGRWPATSEMISKHFVLLVAGIWALHPIQTNAVTYLVQRMASIQALFFILSTACYVKGRRIHREEAFSSKACAWYFASVCAALAAVFSKENSAILPLMLVVTEIWFFESELLMYSWRWLGRRSWAFWAVLALLLGAAFLYSLDVFLRLEAQYVQRYFTLTERLMTEARVVVWYMSLLVWPLPGRLSFDHDVVLSTSLLNPPTTILSIAFIGILLFQSFCWRRRFPLVTYGILWYFLNLLIESTVIPLELIFEHRLYLPSVGFIMAVLTAMVYGLGYISSKWRKLDLKVFAECSLAIVLSLLTVATFIRNEVWENSITLYADCVSKAPEKPRPHANLAVSLFGAGVYDQAIEEAEKALSLGKGKREEYAVSAQVIVGAYTQKQEFQTAIEKGELLLAEFPLTTSDAGALPFLCTNLAEAYYQTGQYDKAYSLTLKALNYLQRFTPPREFYFEKLSIAGAMHRIVAAAGGREIDLDGDGTPDPGELSAQTWVAERLLDQGEREIAKEMLTRTVASGSEDSRGPQLLTTLEDEDNLNRTQRSKWDFNERYVRHPFSRFNFSMAVAFLIRERQLPTPFVGIGRLFLDYAMELEPHSAGAHLLNGWYFFEDHKFKEAMDEAKYALQLEPDYAKAWLGLGFFASKANLPDEAILAFKKALDLFPGYSNRATILNLIANLQGEEPAKPLSAEPNSSALLGGIPPVRRDG